MGESSEAAGAASEGGSAGVSVVVPSAASSAAGGGEGTGFSTKGPSGDDQRMRDANMKLPFRCLLISSNVLDIVIK